MIDEFAVLLRGWTPGGVGVWVLVGAVLIAWWKGLPAVLDAWSNSVARERADRERAIERLEGQIRAADGRHSECMEGQRKLREEIDRLQNVITGMVLQMRQMQLASINGDPIAPAVAPEFVALLQALDKETAKPDAENRKD